jgi:hypothetical protein
METSASFEARSAPSSYPTCRLMVASCLVAQAGLFPEWVYTVLFEVIWREMGLRSRAFFQTLRTTTIG